MRVPVIPSVRRLLMAALSVPLIVGGFAAAAQASTAPGSYGHGHGPQIIRCYPWQNRDHGRCMPVIRRHHHEPPVIIGFPPVPCGPVFNLDGGQGDGYGQGQGQDYGQGQGYGQGYGQGHGQGDGYGHSCGPCGNRFPSLGEIFGLGDGHGYGHGDGHVQCEGHGQGSGYGQDSGYGSGHSHGPVVY